MLFGLDRGKEIWMNMILIAEYITQRLAGCAEIWHWFQGIWEKFKQFVLCLSHSIQLQMFP